MQDQSAPVTDPQPLKHVDRSDGMGDQWIYRFPNGYGASVIQGPHTYGGPEGLFELGVIEFDGDKHHLTYDTPITPDVIGYQSADEIADLLKQIAALPAATVTE